MDVFIHWNADPDALGPVRCSQAPGPVATHSGPDVLLRVLLNADVPEGASEMYPKLTVLRITDITPPPPYVPELLLQDSNGLPVTSSRSTVCDEPDVEAYFEYRWRTDPTIDGSGATDFPNGMYRIAVRIEYSLFFPATGMMEPRAVEQAKEFEKQNVHIQNETFWVDGTPKTVVVKPTPNAIAEQITTRIRCVGGGLMPVVCEIKDLNQGRVATLRREGVPYPGTVTFTWDGVRDLRVDGDRMGGQAAPGVYLFRVRAHPDRYASDDDVSAFVTVREFKAFTASVTDGRAKLYTTYLVDALPDRVLGTPACSSGRIDIYRGDTMQKWRSIPLAGDQLIPGRRTVWLDFDLAPGVGATSHYLVLELTDSHRLSRKARVNKRVLQRGPTAAAGLPVAENFDYVYPDVSSEGYAGLAATRQSAMRDASGYIARARTNQPASVLFAEAQRSAVFHFFGHGGFFNGVGFSSLLCWNGNARSYIVHKEAAAVMVRQQFGAGTEVHVLEALPEGALNRMLLAVLEGCFTANSFPTSGSPAEGMIAKGARAVLGFTACIVGRRNDPNGNYAQRWSEYFWFYATQGWPDGNGVQVGFAQAARAARRRVYDEIEDAEHESALSSLTILPSQANFRIYPAGERDDRPDMPRYPGVRDH